MEARILIVADEETKLEPDAFFGLIDTLVDVGDSWPDAGTVTWLDEPPYRPCGGRLLAASVTSDGRHAIAVIDVQDVRAPDGYTEVVNRDSCIHEVIEALAEFIMAPPAALFVQAAAAVDALIDAGMLHVEPPRF